MPIAPESERVIPVSNLQEFFRESVQTAIGRQEIDVSEDTTWYVVNLLTLYSRSEALYERTEDYYGLRPLALMLREAADASTPEERRFALQRLGDVSLFVAGFFSDSLAHRPVDVDYYVHMGGGAYGTLSDSLRGSVRGRALEDVFRELAGKFQSMVDVLNDVAESARSNSDRDVLRLYELWMRTGSRRAHRLLTELGIEPAPDARNGRTH
jgi:hypothetical protein